MTVMLVGFVNSGIMTLEQTIGVCFGSNIGTTFTAWILCLDGIKESGEGYLISGLSEKESFEELFDIDLESDAATVGGWVTEKLEQIPDEKDEFVFHNIKVVVTKVSNTRVLEVYAEKLPDESEEEEEKEDIEE